MTDPQALLDKATQLRTTFGGDVRTPAQLEAMIHVLTDVLEDFPDVLFDLNEQRYEAERAWAEAKAEGLDRYMEQGFTSTRARAKAELDAMPKRVAYDQARTAWHYADDSVKALTTKLYGLLNINKGQQAAMRGYSHGRT